ncbi:hypothetical protein EDB80DRAFT_835122 [Ilyonectria destructans]|nr:hypothetical protein EDB80DRAFT_835122 [Ilyonectria destructans]
MILRNTALLASPTFNLRTLTLSTLAFGLSRPRLSQATMASQQRTSFEPPPGHRNISPLVYRPKAKSELLAQFLLVVVTFLIATCKLALTITKMLASVPSRTLQNPLSLFDSLDELLDIFKTISKIQLAILTAIVYVCYCLIPAICFNTLHSIQSAYKAWVSLTRALPFRVIEGIVLLAQFVDSIGPQLLEATAGGLILCAGGFLVVYVAYPLFQRLTTTKIQLSYDVDTPPRVHSPSIPEMNSSLKPPDASYVAAKDMAVKHATFSSELPAIMETVSESSTTGSTSHWKNFLEREEPREAGGLDRAWDGTERGKANTEGQHPAFSRLLDEHAALHNRNHQMWSEIERLKKQVADLHEGKGKLPERAPSFGYLEAMASQQEEKKQRKLAEDNCLEYRAELERLRARLRARMREKDEAHAVELHVWRQRVISTEGKLHHVTILEHELRACQKKLRLAMDAAFGSGTET